MRGLTKRQGVQINALLSLIYGHGYDAQTVVNWARDLQKQGYPMAKSYERAFNEFIGGQPELGKGMQRISELMKASDDASIAKYEAALNTYIQTGDGSAIDALGPMIARDSVALAQRNGELRDGAITDANVAAALGFSMAPQFVQAAAQEAGPAPAPAAQQGAAPLVRSNQAAPQFAFRSHGIAQAPAGLDTNNPTQPGGTPYSSRQANMNATFSVASTTSRTILEGRVVNPVADGVVGEVGI